MKYDVPPQTLVDIHKRFHFHLPTLDQCSKYEEIRETLGMVALGLHQSCPASRELSLALTHLEEVGFWANASIARNE